MSTPVTAHIQFRRAAAGHYVAGAFAIDRTGPGLWKLTHAGAFVCRYTSLDAAKRAADDMAGLDALDLFAAAELDDVDAEDVELDGDTETGTLFVIPCAAQKADSPKPARELYTSANFRHVLTAAEAEAAATTRELGTPARVVILSALHGILELDDVVDPYDVKMGIVGSIATDRIADQLRRLDPRTVCAMLPRAYGRALAGAVDQVNAAGSDVEYLDLYEYSPGIGYQRGTATAITRNAA